MYGTISKNSEGVNMAVEKKSFLRITDIDGKPQQVEVVMAFFDEKSDKQYIVYTKNEKRENNTVILYASILKEQEGQTLLENVTDEEWALIKDKMREIVRKEGVSQAC